jgi:hypothetical protein
VLISAVYRFAASMTISGGDFQLLGMTAVCLVL